MPSLEERMAVRRQKILGGIDLRTAHGLELGPLDRPIITTADGPVRYVDYLDAAALRAKYANDANVDKAKIVPVDVVCRGVPLEAAIGGTGACDYIVASHVAEHVPNLVAWVEELRAVLRPGGTIRLVVPDRRFTMDYLRRESTLTDVLHAYALRTCRPLPYAVLDFKLQVTTVDVAEAWEGRLNPAALRRIHSVDEAIATARDAYDNGTYHEVHCWVFTPRSFGLVMAQLAEAGLLHLACEEFFDSAPYEFDFIIRLRPAGCRQEIVESWRRMHDAARELPER